MDKRHFGRNLCIIKINAVKQIFVRTKKYPGFSMTYSSRVGWRVLLLLWFGYLVGGGGNWLFGNMLFFDS